MPKLFFRPVAKHRSLFRLTVLGDAAEDRDLTFCALGDEEVTIRSAANFTGLGHIGGI